MPGAFHWRYGVGYVEKCVDSFYLEYFEALFAHTICVHFAENMKLKGNILNTVGCRLKW